MGVSVWRPIVHASGRTESVRGANAPFLVGRAVITRLLQGAGGFVTFDATLSERRRFERVVGLDGERGFGLPVRSRNEHDEARSERDDTRAERDRTHRSDPKGIDGRAERTETN